MFEVGKSHHVYCNGALKNKEQVETRYTEQVFIEDDTPDGVRQVQHPNLANTTSTVR